LAKCFWGGRPPSGGFAFYRERSVRTAVYIDGFNLYYSLLRRTSLKWLDVVALFRDHVLGSTSQLTEVRYYTAPVLARMSDDPQSV
jgi:hypothetical protein